MARLTALPSLDIIHGFRGILDFYLWKGLPCVRRWPRMTKAQQSPATIDAGILFGEISSAFALVGDGALQAFQEDAADQPRTARDIYMTATFGHLHERTQPPPPPPPEEEMYDAYVCLRDLKAPNTPGGTFTAGAWQTRDLTELQADPADIATLAANQITLPAGSYRALIRCPAYRVSVHKARLYNVSQGTVLLLGTSEHAHANYLVTNHSTIVGRFALDAETTLEIQHRSTATFANQGFGCAVSWADEIYTLAEFWREIEEE